MKWLVCLCHFCEQHGPNVLSCSEYSLLAERTLASKAAPPSEAKLSDESQRQSSRCGACYPFDAEESAYVSVLTNRLGEKIVISTTPEIANADEYAAMRHACVRALIREVTPGLEGAVLFTIEEESAEDKIGRRTHVLSYSFTMQDKFARGFRRSYAILVCCVQASSSVSPAGPSRHQSGGSAEEDASINELRSGSQLAHDISSEAVAMNDVTTSEYVLALVPQLIRRLYIFVQQVKAKCDAVFERDQQAGSGRALRLQNPSWQPNVARSICTLLDDAFAMRSFHAFFAELLYLVAGNFSLQQALPPPSSHDARSTESGGLHSSRSERSSPFADIRDVLDSFRRRTNAVSASDRDSEAAAFGGSAFPTRSMSSAGAGDRARAAANDDFAELLYHVLIGNQVVCVCESDVSVAEAFLRVLAAQLLPQECAQLSVSDSSYVEAFACNLLALRNVNALPAEVSDDANLYGVVILTLATSSGTESHAKRQYVANLHRRGAPNSNSDAERDRRRRVAAITEVGRIVALVASDIDMELINEALSDIRIELLNKARVFYACFKLGMFTDMGSAAADADQHSSVANQRNKLIEILNGPSNLAALSSNARANEIRSTFDAQQVLFMFFARAIASEFTARQKALASAGTASASTNHQSVHAQEISPNRVQHA